MSSTLQHRIAAGGLQFMELPAGIADGRTFAGTAEREIKKELGIVVPEKELVNLAELAIPERSEGGGEMFPKAIFPGAGACDEHSCDEYISFSLCEKTVS